MAAFYPSPFLSHSFYLPFPFFQDESFGGMEEQRGNEGELSVVDGKLWLNLPIQSCLVFRQLSPS